MAREIPEVVRAAAGLAATVLDEARKLPETLPGLPVRLIGLAMQQAMKVQQQYAGFVARGDELFTGLRGENEPGLATFDDDEPAPTPTGFRESAFDRAGDAEPTSASGDLIVDDEVAEEPPAIEGILDEIAIDELVDDAPTLEETAPGKPAKPRKAATSSRARKAAEAPATDDAAVTEDAAAVETALLESGESPTAADTVDAEPTADVATTVDVLSPAGDDVATVEGTVTDEGVATATDEGGSPVAAATGVRTDVGESDTAETDTAIAEGAAVDAVGGDSPAPTDDPQGGSDVSGSQAAGAAPVDGYDSFTIAQLRGRLRGYALSTVQDLVAYEEATRARAPYLTLLRNRLEKLEEQAIESSPLAPRGV